jgi:predicted DCC family thiol-disulfide oxidoreductase YuxK
LETYSIIVFDGYCNLCNTFINFVFRFDKNEKFKFAASQSDSGKILIEQYHLSKEQYQTVVLIQTDGSIEMHSTAALIILKQLSFPINLLYSLIIFPKWIRDAFYNFISRNRYRIFGKKNSCRLPDEKEINRFL